MDSWTHLAKFLVLNGGSRGSLCSALAVNQYLENLTFLVVGQALVSICLDLCR